MVMMIMVGILCSFHVLRINLRYRGRGHKFYETITISRSVYTVCSIVVEDNYENITRSVGNKSPAESSSPMGGLLGGQQMEQ